MEPQVIKMGERTRFALKLLSKQLGASMNTVIEDMVLAAADALPISRHWTTLFDEEESVRLLNCFTLPEYKISTKVVRGPRKALPESDIRAFCFAHWQFFWADKQRNIVKRPYAVVLWKNIEEYVELWNEKRGEDYWCAARKMATVLKKATGEAPTFG